MRPRSAATRRSYSLPQKIGLPAFPAQLVLSLPNACGIPPFRFRAGHGVAAVRSDLRLWRSGLWPGVTDEAPRARRCLPKQQSTCCEPGFRRLRRPWPLPRGRERHPRRCAHQQRGRYSTRVWSASALARLSLSLKLGGAGSIFATTVSAGKNRPLWRPPTSLHFRLAFAGYSFLSSTGCFSGGRTGHGTPEMTPATVGAALPAVRPSAEGTCQPRFASRLRSAVSAVQRLRAAVERHVMPSCVHRNGEPDWRASDPNSTAIPRLSDGKTCQ